MERQKSVYCFLSKFVNKRINAGQLNIAVHLKFYNQNREIKRTIAAANKYVRIDNITYLT